MQSVVVFPNVSSDGYTVPSREALIEDIRNGGDLDLSFLKDAYLQPELKERISYPELSPEKKRDLGFEDYGSFTSTSEHSDPENPDEQKPS